MAKTLVNELGPLNVLYKPIMSGIMTTMQLVFSTTSSSFKVKEGQYLASTGTGMLKI
jgi:hypothetical protein